MKSEKTKIMKTFKYNKKDTVYNLNGRLLLLWKICWKFILYCIWYRIYGGYSWITSIWTQMYGHYLI